MTRATESTSGYYGLTAQQDFNIELVLTPTAHNNPKPNILARQVSEKAFFVIMCLFDKLEGGES